MKIGIFGGTFDPFTEAHAAIVAKLLGATGNPFDKPLVDKVVVAPTIVEYHREGKIPWLTDEQKVDLIKVRLMNDPFISKLPSKKIGNWDIWDTDFKIREICKKSKTLEEKYVNGHRFIDTLLSIIEYYSTGPFGGKCNNEYYVVIGSDSYWNFKSWSMWEDIVNLAKLIVVKGRDGIDLPSAANGYPSCIEMSIDTKYANTSSSKEREAWQDKGYEAYKNYVINNLNQFPKDELLTHTPIFDVIRENAQEKENGSMFHPIKIIAPDWVTTIVEKDGSYLMVQQLRYGVNREMVEFPCGQVEVDEEPRYAAARELEEETGILISPANLQYLGTCSPNPAFMTNHMHYFYANLDDASYVQKAQKLDENEKIKIIGVKKENLMEAIAYDKDTSAMMLNAIRLIREMK